MLNYKSIILLATLIISDLTGFKNLSGLAHAALNDTAVAITTDKSKVTTALANITVPFEENRGQADAKVAFQAKTLAGTLFVTKDGELVWSLIPPSTIDRFHAPRGNADKDALRPVDKFVGPPAPTYSVVEKFVGGAAPKPTGKTAAATQVNYFHGNDKSKWHSGVPTWQQVSLGEVWPGIEVSVSARGNNAEKLFTVAPWADVSKIAIAVKEGNLEVASDGGLSVIPKTNIGCAEERSASITSDAHGERSAPCVDVDDALPVVSASYKNEVLKFTAPVAWQEINGERKPVTVAYRLKTNHPHSTPPSPVMEREPGGEVIYGFTLGPHDPTQPVIIDPLIQATYLGGSSYDAINAIAVSSSAVYVIIM